MGIRVGFFCQLASVVDGKPRWLVVPAALVLVCDGLDSCIAP